MRWAWSFVVVLAACGSKAPPPRHTNPGAAYAVLPSDLQYGPVLPLPPPAVTVAELSTPIVRAKPLVPRPAIDFSVYQVDFHDELRWPLSAISHPSLEPRFAIVQALADPGVSLEKLCSLGAQSRHGIDPDLDGYLRGWCSALGGNIDAACEHLVPLLGSTKGAMSAAIRVDLPNILADYGDADTAERFLNRHRIWNLEILDRLAATYVETGTTNDAIAINRLAMQSDDDASLASRCTRITRDIVLGGNREELALAPLRALGEPRSGRGDPTCSELFHKVACWARVGCDPFYRDHGGGDETAFQWLRQAYDRWSDANTPKEWHLVANEAMLAIPMDGALALTLAAFENEMEADGLCDGDEKEWLTTRIGMSWAGFTPDLEREYRRLRARCP